MDLGDLKVVAHEVPIVVREITLALQPHAQLAVPPRARVAEEAVGEAQDSVLVFCDDGGKAGLDAVAPPRIDAIGHNGVGVAHGLDIDIDEHRHV